MIDRMEVKVPSFFIEERLSIYNSQFGEEASGIPMVSRTRKTRLESLGSPRLGCFDPSR